MAFLGVKRTAVTSRIDGLPCPFRVLFGGTVVKGVTPPAEVPSAGAPRAEARE
ncbi:hypothetical protein SAMN05216275_104191 [Streptosporangium canum]|uniref:Uncharacterized protein n=1 Tax=Streptosporangium canum TaxID=324952 RepID=A0A1I3K074_9ACTN|nr:hypothetical protein SAMN05216275_104191 [Streptosporangium canum]